MVLVDTSVWIEYLEKNNTFEGKIPKLMDEGEIATTGLITGELIQGASTPKEIKLIQTFLATFKVLKEGLRSWEKAGILSFETRKKGKIIGLADCYLAILALETDSAIFTLDRHFKEIAKFTGISLHNV